MIPEPNIPTTSDERTLGGLAHLFGLVGALIVLVAQKDRSRFVRFQAVQALAFDLTVMILFMVLFACLFGTLFVSMFGMMLIPLASESSPQSVISFLAIPFVLFPGMFACIYPCIFAVLIARIAAAISVLNGKDFRYPLLGAQVEKLLTSQK